MSRARVALLLVLALLAPACGITHISDLRFTVDDRLHWVSPPDRARVAQPLTLRWTMRDFTVWHPGDDPTLPNSGYFAVFVDQTPIKPGQTMKAVARGDRFCQRTPGCPDKTYLENHQVFTTSDTTLVIHDIATLPNDKEIWQLHVITVVLMSPTGHRIGESAWERDVRIHKVTL